MSGREVFVARHMLPAPLWLLAYAWDLISVPDASVLNAVGLNRCVDFFVAIRTARSILPV